jgi:hypothetical protein
MSPEQTPNRWRRWLPVTLPVVLLVWAVSQVAGVSVVETGRERVDYDSINSVEIIAIRKKANLLVLGRNVGSFRWTSKVKRSPTWIDLD